MRKIFIFLLTFILFISLISHNTKAKSSPPKVSADGVVLMDATTGDILYSKNKDSKYPPASTTKIMTALLALENCKLDDVVTVGKKPPFADGSKICILKDEKLTVKDLLYGLLLQSANDCAEALAEHISGSTEEFAKLMNKRAAELGCKNTNFVNPHGLYDDNHRTSALDLALILKELTKYPEYKEISTTSMYYIEPTAKSKEKRPLWNKNKLIQKNSKYYYEGCEGGKTGYTIQSKHSYVAIASRNGQRLIAILLHDSERTYWSDVRKLFDYGFDNFTLESFYLEGDSLGDYTLNENTKIPLLCAENFYYVKGNTSTEVPQFKINNKDLNKESFKRGDNILTAAVTYNNEAIGTLKIASGVNYSPKSFLMPLGNNYDDKFLNILKISGYVVSVLLAIVFILRIRKKIRDRKRRKNRKENTLYMYNSKTRSK
ncbi:D-alanyl-D-alanine carboxypeptidase family protein [Clostridium ganghwense]|uniref:D-alanyl-D-alanine carboxypeptidase n=1 Tax=Clostridium ganghwense TaxID=312089 RepID=A0ABT4CTU5_9CLOT|nr:D-alanyl-D-alanine carboxypeptidase family protein [Clostridium ganghwense]MCY6371848.1 D-alanyl-D-alanine carboxypeptidase [Clostridium ganghwense]